LNGRLTPRSISLIVSGQCHSKWGDAVKYSLSVVVFLLAVVTILPVNAADVDPTGVDAMNEENNANWRILWSMQELAPDHDLTIAVQDYVVAEYEMLVPINAFADCESEVCQQQASIGFLEKIPAYTSELREMMRYQDNVWAGDYEVPGDLYPLWVEFFPAEERPDAEQILAALSNMHDEYLAAKQATNSQVEEPPKDDPNTYSAAASTRMVSSNSGGSPSASAQRSTTPEYRSEYVKGDEYLVGSHNGTEVWVQMICRNGGCNKLYARVLVKNESNSTFDFVPETDVDLVVYNKSNKSTFVHTFSASEWINKQENKAAWQAVGTGLLVGLANSGPSGTYSGSVSAYNNYGGTAYGTYYGTYTDYDAKAEKIARESEYYASQIAEAFENNTASLLWAETLSPGEYVIGEVYFKKFSNQLNRAKLTVKAGRQEFEFSYQLK
jgi:hypothetical protein